MINNNNNNNNRKCHTSAVLQNERREREWSREPRFPPGPPWAIALVFFFTGCEVRWRGAGSKQGATIWGR